jgi:hypothetical protein
MGRDGTDVARGAADLILTDDNFASIVAGIEEGRVAYDNVRKLIFLLVSTGLGEIVLFLLAIAAGLPLPLFAVQLLWLNLVTNGIQDVALAFERGEPGILERRPRRRGESLFDRRMLGQVLVSGGYMGVCAFGFYFWALESGMAEERARNLLLLHMVLFENVHALNARSERRSVFAVPFAANPFLILAIFGAQGCHVAALYLPGLSDVLAVEPITAQDWLLVAGLALSLLLVMELRKAWLRRSNPRWGAVCGGLSARGRKPPALRRIVLQRSGVGLGVAAAFAALGQRPAALLALGLFAPALPLRGTVGIQIDDFTHRFSHSSARFRVGSRRAPVNLTGSEGLPMSPVCPQGCYDFVTPGRVTGTF